MNAHKHLGTHDAFNAHDALKQCRLRPPVPLRNRSRHQCCRHVARPADSTLLTCLCHTVRWKRQAAGSWFTVVFLRRPRRISLCCSEQSRLPHRGTSSRHPPQSLSATRSSHFAISAAPVQLTTRSDNAHFACSRRRQPRRRRAPWYALPDAKTQNTRVGVARTFNFEVAQVLRPILSVAMLNSTVGFRVERNSFYVTLLDGQRIPTQREMVRCVGCYVAS